MSKRIKYKWIVATLVIAFVFLLFAIPTLVVHMATPIFMFADISECIAMEDRMMEDGRFIKNKDQPFDDDLADLQYSSSFCGNYSCDQYSFKIFAYEFESEALAKEYFKNVTGKNTGQQNPNFSVSSGVFESRIVVLDEDRAYSLSCPTHAIRSVSQMLEACFSIRMKQ